MRQTASGRSDHHKKKPPPIEIKLKLLARGPQIAWDLAQIAASIGTTESDARHLFANNHALVPLIAVWATSHGFERQSAGATGYFFISKKTSASYRFVLARNSIVLNPAVKKGQRLDGYAIIFAAELPTPHFWFASKAMLQVLQERDLLNYKGRGKAQPVRDYFAAQGVASVGLTLR